MHQLKKNILSKARGLKDIESKGEALKEKYNIPQEAKYETIDYFANLKALSGKSDEQIIKNAIDKAYKDDNGYFFESIRRHEKNGLSRKEAEYLVATDERKGIEHALNITPIKEYGRNYAEYYHDGIGAFKKLLIEKQGQVSGAFNRQDLGDIDLVWGKVKKENDGTYSGYGLAKIQAKHPEITAEILDDVVRNGKLENINGKYSILKDDFRVGLELSDYSEAKNKWILTAYDTTDGGKGKIKTLKSSQDKTPPSDAKTAELSAEPTSSQPEIKNDLFQKAYNKYQIHPATKSLYECVKDEKSLRTGAENFIISKGLTTDRTEAIKLANLYESRSITEFKKADEIADYIEYMRESINLIEQHLKEPIKGFNLDKAQAQKVLEQKNIKLQKAIEKLTKKYENIEKAVNRLKEANQKKI